MKTNFRKYGVTVALIWLPCILVFSIAYMWIVRPQSQKRTDTEKRLVEARKLCDAAVALTQEKTRAELNSRLESMRDKIKDYVVSEKDCAELTFAINKIAIEKNISGISIHAADGQPDPAKSGFSQIYEKRISVAFTSGFNQFATFLNALERYQPVIFIDDFHMTRSADKPTGHSISMNLVVLVRKAAE